MISNLLFQHPALGRMARESYQLGVKLAGDLAPSYSLTGDLYRSYHKDKPWLLLSVPNAMVRGVFDALHEPGIELPLQSDGTLVAHISVINPDEIELAGGEKSFINDRGKPFRYSIGGLATVDPDGWPDVDKVWLLRVFSPELQRLRLSHGLSALPDEGRKPFHITVARRMRGVTGRNDKTKDPTPA